MDLATAPERWVIDGNYSSVHDVIWTKADTVVWFDLPFSSCFRAPSGAPCAGSSPARSCGTATGSRSPISGRFNPERSIIAWAATRHGNYRRRYLAAESDPRWSGLQFVRVRSQGEADALRGRCRRQALQRSERVDLELAGKVVLITGGTDGLGLALAAQLAGEGGSVAVCGRSEDRLASARTKSRQAGGTCWRCRRMSRDPEDLERFVDLSVARWGRIDAVVHNAGRASGGSIESIDDSTWEEDFQLKLMASVRLTRLALPHCAPVGGRCCSRWPCRPRRRAQGANRVRSTGRPVWP